MTPEQVLDVMVERLREVMGTESADPPGGDRRALRFDEDLHADSLDLVEIIEGVERTLAARGHPVSIPDAELVALQSVGEAVDRILAHLRTDRGVAESAASAP